MENHGRLSGTMKVMSFLIFFAFPSLAVWAAPQIKVSADPIRSKGESVTFRIRVESEVRELVRNPRIPIFTDWQLINNFQSRQLTSRLINGKIVSRNSWETTLILKPLRRGTLKIPSIALDIGDQEYKTEEIDIQVDQLAKAPQNTPRGSIPLFPFDPTDPSAPHEEEADAQGGSVPGLGNPNRNIEPPSNSEADESIAGHEKESFFLRAEPSKTTVFAGEMLLLSYSLYQKNIMLSNAEIGKFPEFKGFLKEDLLVPKHFAKAPVEFNGQNWFRSEIIRYALFPIQTGSLKIDPMVFRGTVQMGNMSDIIQDLINGQPPTQQSEVQMSKSSQVLDITVKPLPAAPAGTKFTGGVGQFEMQTTVSSKQVSVDQPFTITLKIKGIGNVQAIEESPLVLPPQIESFQTKHQHQFSENGSGETVFEYLLMPRQPGEFDIPAIEFTYFDPKLVEYKTLKSDPFIFTATGTAGGPAKEKSEEKNTAAPKVFSFPSLVSGKLEKISNLGKLKYGFATLPVWLIVLMFYAAALNFYFVQRRRFSYSLFLKTSPWKKVEEKILSKKDWSASEIAEMLDEWMRHRLSALCTASTLDHGSAREEFLDNLKAQMVAENFSKLTDLKNLWSDLDLFRFAGNKTAASQKQKSQDWLYKVEKLVQSIDKARIQTKAEDEE